MADTREVVSRKTSSTTRQESIQQSSQQSSTVVISTSNIQLKQKQKQESVTVNSNNQSQQMQSQVQNQSQQQQQQQQSFTQKQIQNQQKSFIQQQQSAIAQKQQLDNQKSQRNEAEQLTTEDDLKVTDDGVTNCENELYFSNMIKNEQLLNSESYSLSDDVPDSNNLVGNNNNNNSNNISNIIVHPDLISGLAPLSQPPSLVLSIDVDSQSHEISSSNSSNKSSVEDSSDGQNENHDEGGDDEDEDDDSLTINKERKKKKKVKKTESFSVIEVLDVKMKNLASKYEVCERTDSSVKPCELRASEKRVFEKVSVANLRRSFCDLTTNSHSNHHNEDEFTFHLVERPKSFTNLDYTIDFGSIKSSFSKFEGGATNNRESAERDTANAKNELQNTNGLAMECAFCHKRVYAMEKFEAGGRILHKTCVRCSVCNVILSVDSYESNGGKLYCKPHFKELFQPKAVFESPEEAILKRLKKRPELIIRENQPVELPPDVVRATIQPSTADLEDLSVDVKSKFELFEHFKDSEAASKEKREPIVVRRSTSVLQKLAKYEGGMESGVGVSDSDLNGGVPTVVSDDEDEISTPKYLEEININLDAVKSKWESGINSKKEELHKHRQEEMAKFRTRLCLGKNSQLKEMYEKAVESNVDDTKKTLDLEELDLKGKRNIKEMFENMSNLKPEDGEVNGRESAIDRDREVFESGVAKTSRNLFQNLDKQVASGGQLNNSTANNPKKICFKNPNGIIGVNDDQSGEIVKSSDVIQDQFRSEDVGSKFRFFETFKENQQAPKKVFRITPPRDGQVKMDSPEREIYRDPNVIRSGDDAETKIPVARTASKMLSVFKRLEETAGTDEADRQVRRPLKQFTPPRETRLERKDSSEEEEESSEYESEEEDNENGGDMNNEDSLFLKEVGSLARAKSLRAKFEKWEIEENSRNQRESRLQEDLNGGSSIADVCKSIRSKFEQPQIEPQKLPRKEVQVKRFVELQNSNGLAMEECVMCNKKVYAMEKIEAGSKIYHKTCFRCSQCKCILRMDTFTQNKGTLYCTPHFKQLFKIKGNYDEGFGHETGKQIWMKKQLQQKTESSGSDTKEN